MDKSKRQSLPPRGVPRGRKKKKRDDEEKKDDVPADTSNVPNDNNHSENSKVKRPKMNIDKRKEPVREQRGISNQSQFAPSFNPPNPRPTSKPQTREKQGAEEHVLERSFYLMPGEIEKDSDKLQKVQDENMAKKYIQLYKDWTDYEPWRLMAFGNGIEPLAPTEPISFLKMDTLRRCKDYITYNVRRPADRNCIIPFDKTKSRTRNCACQHCMQYGMKEYYPSHFAPTKEGEKVQLDTFTYEEANKPISTDVTDYLATRLQFLLACRDLMEPAPRFTDRQIYRHLRQSTFVVSKKEKWAVIFHGDITKKDALPFMSPSCVFHLLEPLGVLPKPTVFLPKGDEKDAMNKILKDKKEHKYDDLKNLNYLAGLRVYAAFFAYQGSKTHPFPRKPTDGTNLFVHSIEYNPLRKLDWHKKTVAGRLQIFQEDNRKDNTVNDNFCHRMDFHHRLKRTGEALLMLHANLLTKIQHNLVGIGDNPSMKEVYDNLLSLYGHAMLISRFNLEYNKALGCLKPMENSEDPLIVIASGNLVYSHDKSVAKDHGYRHSVFVPDKIVIERDGVTSATKEQLVSREDFTTKKARAKQKSKVLHDSVEDYLAKLEKGTPVTNFLDLYNPKFKLSDWDTKLEKEEKYFDYIFEKVEEENEVKSKRTGVKHNRVKHTVIALCGKPLYYHDTNRGRGRYNADYCAFLIPPSLRSMVSQFHEYILHENGYEVSGMIQKGMVRVNGNDNLFAYTNFESCTDFFKRFGCAPPEQISDVVKDVTKAIRDGCEIAEYRKKTGFLNDKNCFIRMRLQCNLPDLTKTTMECKKTAYPLTQLDEAAKQDVTVFSGILPLHNTGLLHQAYSGDMNTSKIEPGKRFEGDSHGFVSFRGLPVFIAPDSFVLYPGALPIATGMPLTPGISYFIEIDVQLSWKVQSPALPLSSLTDRSGLDCYLTSAGPAMSFFDKEQATNVKQKLEEADKHPGETSFDITKDVTLPSVVYWSKHGKESLLGLALLDQIDPLMEKLGRAIWFGNFEHPVAEGDNNKDPPRLGSFESVPPHATNSQPQTGASEQLVAGDSGSHTGQPLQIDQQVPLQAAAAQQPPTVD